MSPLPKLKKSIQLGAATGAITLGTFSIWARNCHIENRPQGMESIMQSPLYHKLNPESNPAIYDRCIRYVDFSLISPELLEDARCGGPKLVNAFSGGLWGSSGESEPWFLVQRKYLEFKYRNEATAHQTWDVDDILKDNYEQGSRSSPSLNTRPVADNFVERGQAYVKSSEPANLNN
ncbi:hypothetical protein G7Z17_g2335 [Cylindrodendrum hubeiense]|uniref:Uncharacterized protein n=1 Tax=Cylindrodendrum hubeiense TaxID=595255 RepID=A0A9P5HJX5_9HYPO|nr:hypothetical protein G7Z17_g2335 [Cylindrodendrum hubeiense]